MKPKEGSEVLLFESKDLRGKIVFAFPKGFMALV